MDFHLYVATELILKLPFKKRYLIIGDDVCKWGVVKPTAKAAYMLGCTLAITEPKSAEHALQVSTSPNNWRATYNGIVDNLISRMDINSEITNYDDLIPEWQLSSTPDETLLDILGCINAIGHRVILGLITGLLNTSVGTTIIKSWISHDQIPDMYLLTIKPQYKFSSFEYAQEHAKIVYQNWINGESYYHNMF
jgi:hypothetical protein